MMARKRGNAFLIVLVLGWILSGLFPPWVYTFTAPAGRGSATKPAGYFPLWAPPAPARKHSLAGVRIDLDRLLIQWAIIAVIGGAHIVLRRPRRDAETARGGGNDA